MKRQKDRRQDTAHRTVCGAPEYPPELCLRCVWVVGQGERKLCPFPRCVVCTAGWKPRPGF